MLARRALSASFTAAAVVAGFGLFAGLVRLLPWLLAPEVPIEVSLPFARALAASATETGFLVGAPVGFALAASRLVEDGEARALAALGVSPFGLTVSLWPAILGIALSAFVTGVSFGEDSPGRFASELVRQGRESCARAKSPRSRSVPLVNVTWLCFPGSAPVISGPLPGSNGRAWFTASDLGLSDDLGRATLSDLTVVTRAGERERALHLHVRTGVVSGLPVWGRGAKLSVFQRSLLSAVTSGLLSFAAVLALLTLALGSRARALALGGLPALGALVLLHRLDAALLPPVAHLLVPLTGLGVSAVLGVTATRVARFKW